MKVFWRSIHDRSRANVWWTVGVIVAVGSSVALWASVRGNEDMDRLAQDLPEAVRALIGMQEGISLSSAAGYLQARLFSTLLPIVLIVYAISLGARMIGGAEEDGTLQLVVTAPLPRRRVAIERVTASSVMLLGLVAVAAVTAFAVGIAVGIFDDVNLGRMIIVMVAVTELALLHLSFAFAVGASTGRRGPAVSVAGALAVGGYVINGIAASVEPIRSVRMISPWWWFLDRNLLVHHDAFLALGLPILLSAFVVAIGVRRFVTRDLRFP